MTLSTSAVAVCCCKRFAQLVEQPRVLDGDDRLRGEGRDQLDADEVDATLDWAPELCTAGGVLHGGVVMALADTAGAVCAFLNLPAGASTVTIESKTNFLGAIREGEVLARSRPLHVGERRSSSRRTSSTRPGRRVARTTQTQAVLRPGERRRPRYPPAAVAVAQLVEPRVVVPVVAGSSPVRHP